MKVGAISMIRMFTIPIPIFIAFVLTMLYSTFVSAQEPAAPEQSANDTESAGAISQSGYENITTFGGPESVGARLKENDQERASMYQFDGMQRGLKPYFD